MQWSQTDMAIRTFSCRRPTGTLTRPARQGTPCPFCLSKPIRDLQSLRPIAKLISRPFLSRPCTGEARDARSFGKPKRFSRLRCHQAEFAALRLGVVARHISSRKAANVEIAGSASAFRKNPHRAGHGHTGCVVAATNAVSTFARRERNDSLDHEDRCRHRKWHGWS